MLWNKASKSIWKKALKKAWDKSFEKSFETNLQKSLKKALKKLWQKSFEKMLKRSSKKLEKKLLKKLWKKDSKHLWKKALKNCFGKKSFEKMITKTLENKKKKTWLHHYHRYLLRYGAESPIKKIFINCGRSPGYGRLERCYRFWGLFTDLPLDRAPYVVDQWIQVWGDYVLTEYDHGHCHASMLGCIIIL